jgi:hypothetical protein
MKVVIYSSYLLFYIFGEIDNSVGENSNEKILIFPLSSLDILLIMDKQMSGFLGF